MQRYLALAIVITSCGGATVSGQNVSRLYSREKLETDAKRWAEQIRAEYHDTVLPQLNDQERKALRGIKIEVPLSGPNGDPFEFYTDGSAVYLPALSLRFYSDLCVANSWLNTHGFDGTTVRDYVGWLFRQAAASSRAPLPPVFRTLGVPDNARDETRVSNRADRNFGNTIVFLLAHELGHVLKKHRTDLSDPIQKRKQEIEADQFAIEVMRRIGQMPLGVELWFDVERIRHFEGVRHVAAGKFPSDAEWQKYLANFDHPVTTERLDAIATTIENSADSFARNQTDPASWAQRYRAWAEFFRLGAAQWTTTAIASMAEYSHVRDLSAADLKPRKAAFTLPGSEQEPEFNGLFEVRRTAAGGGEDKVDLLLLRTGDETMGGYSNGKVDGFVEGKIVDGVLHFTWREGNVKGRGTAQSQGDTLRGTWGTGDSEQGGGKWTGVRQKKKNTDR